MGTTHGTERGAGMAGELTPGIRLAVTCPKCYRPPAIRVTQDEVEAKRAREPGYVVASYECRWCGERYPITARAYHDAA